MGTLNYTIGRYAAGRGLAPNTMSSYVRTSDAFTTSTTASYVEDGSGDITLAYGEIVRAHADEDMWIRVNAVATVGDGLFIPSGTTIDFEVHEEGKLSVIDVA